MKCFMGLSVSRLRSHVVFVAWAYIISNYKLEELEEPIQKIFAHLGYGRKLLHGQGGTFQSSSKAFISHHIIHLQKVISNWVFHFFGGQSYYLNSLGKYIFCLTRRSVHHNLKTFYSSHHPDGLRPPTVETLPSSNLTLKWRGNFPSKSKERNIYLKKRIVIIVRKILKMYRDSRTESERGSHKSLSENRHVMIVFVESGFLPCAAYQCKKLWHKREWTWWSDMVRKRRNCV